MGSFFITGASSGLGLSVARQLATAGGHRLILPMRDAARAAGLSRELLALGAAHVDTPALELASLADVHRFVAAFDAGSDARLDGVLFNAGVQAAGALETTEDGFERTFAVNHLAQLLLFKGLARHLHAGARVGWTASGTHDPQDTAARLTGFRGARYTSARQLAQAVVPAGSNAAQACRDAYATSKLCNIVTARALAERSPGSLRFFSFDPGLMPGTGLARRHPAAAQWVWRQVLPRIAALIPGTSTPAKSAAVLVDLLTGRLPFDESGAYFNYLRRQVMPAEPATSRWALDDLMAGSEALLASFGERSDRAAQADRERSARTTRQPSSSAITAA